MTMHLEPPPHRRRRRRPPARHGAGAQAGDRRQLLHDPVRRHRPARRNGDPHVAHAHRRQPRPRTDSRRDRSDVRHRARTTTARRGIARPGCHGPARTYTCGRIAWITLGARRTIASMKDRVSAGADAASAGAENRCRTAAGRPRARRRRNPGRGALPSARRRQPGNDPHAGALGKASRSRQEGRAPARRRRGRVPAVQPTEEPVAIEDGGHVVTPAYADARP